MENYCVMTCQTEERGKDWHKEQNVLHFTDLDTARTFFRKWCEATELWVCENVGQRYADVTLWNDDTDTLMRLASF